VLTAACLRAFVIQPEHCPAVSPEQIRSSIDAAIDWAVRTQHDGKWIYRYDADDDRDLGIYEMVRHAGLLAALYQADAAGFAGARAAADAAQVVALDNAVRGDGVSRLGDEVGASALWLVGLTFAPAPDRSLMHELATFLARSVADDGSVPERPGASTYSPFYTGETAWALARMHLMFPDEGWDKPVGQILRYVALDRDAREGWFPPIPDHWIAHTLSEVVKWRPLTDYEERYAQRLSELESLQIRYESQRTNSVFSKLTRGSQALGAGVGTLAESLAALWQTTRIGALRDRAECAAAQLVERQIDAAHAQRYARPDLVEGTWLHKGITQIDDQQHPISGLIGVLEILDA
jgi:hypothetical protein